MTEEHAVYIYTHTHVLSVFSRVQLCATPWTVARQAPLSMGFSRQELSFPPPEYTHTHTHTHACAHNGMLLSHEEENVATCSGMDGPEGIVLSEIDQREKDRCCMIPLICGL